MEQTYFSFHEWIEIPLIMHVLHMDCVWWVLFTQIQIAGKNRGFLKADVCVTKTVQCWKEEIMLSKSWLFEL